MSNIRALEEENERLEKENLNFTRDIEGHLMKNRDLNELAEVLKADKLKLEEELILAKKKNMNVSNVQSSNTVVYLIVREVHN